MCNTIKLNTDVQYSTLQLLSTVDGLNLNDKLPCVMIRRIFHGKHHRHLWKCSGT